MGYDLITGGTDDYSTEDFFTIGKLIEVLKQNSQYPVRFLGSDFTINSLGSWRGSYDIPAISYFYVEGGRLAGAIAAQLESDLGEVHHGWKGGEYKYHRDEEFFVAQSGCSSEHKVVKFQIEDGELILYTKLAY
jgi:hypothetical protein